MTRGHLNFYFMSSEWHIHSRNTQFWKIIFFHTSSHRILFSLWLPKFYHTQFLLLIFSIDSSPPSPPPPPTCHVLLRCGVRVFWAATTSCSTRSAGTSAAPAGFSRSLMPMMMLIVSAVIDMLAPAWSLGKRKQECIALMGGSPFLTSNFQGFLCYITKTDHLQYILCSTSIKIIRWGEHFFCEQ